jgi:hypothetical protein
MAETARIKAAQWFEDRDSATNLQRDAFRNGTPPSSPVGIDTVVDCKPDLLARSGFSRVLLPQEGRKTLGDRRSMPPNEDKGQQACT